MAVNGGAQVLVTYELSRRDEVAITGVTPQARGGTVVRIWRLPPVS